jgi:hypothetical protein
MCNVALHALVGQLASDASCRRTHKEIIDLKDGIFGTSSTAAADPKAISRRMAHGVLMAVNFIVILPLGALAARQLRCHWIKSPRIRASLFYVHIILQVLPVVQTLERSQPRDVNTPLDCCAAETLH